MAFKRRRMSKRASKRLFRKTANKVHKFNRRVMPMRGGIRL